MATETATHPVAADNVPSGNVLDAGDEDEDALEGLLEQDADGASDLEDDEDTQPDGSQDDEADAEGKGATPRDADGWAAIIAETPTRIAEVPARLRGQAAAAAIQLATTRATEEVETELSSRMSAVQEDAFRKGQQAMMLDLTLQGIHQQFDEDPNTLRELKASNPQLHRVYLSWVAQGGPERDNGQSRQAQTERIDDSGYSQREWSELNQKLASRPDVVAELEAQGPWQKGPRLYRTADRLLKQAEEAEKVASRRQTAATKRKALPKPDVTPGRSNGNVFTIEGLKKLSRAEMDRVMEENPDAVYRTLNGGGAAKR